MVRRNTFQRSRRHRQGDVSCHQYPFKKAILLLGGVIMSVGVLIVQMRTATSIGPSSVPSDLSARRTDITSASNSSSSSSSTRTLLLVTPGPTYKSFSDVPMTEFVVYESDYFYHTSFTEATIVEKQTDPWFTPQKLCQETCCAESVAISLDQDNHHIINTLDGPDLADVLLQQYPNNDAAIRFFGAQMNLAMLPCFQPGTIIHVDNHVMLLEYFFRYWRPRITVPYILITSESDSDSPAVFEDKLSTDPLLIKWFGQSPDASRIPQDGKNKFEGSVFEAVFGIDKLCQPNRYSIDVQAVDPVNVDEDFYKILFVKFNIEHASEKRKALYDSLCSGVNQTKHRLDEVSCSTVSLYPYQVYQAASSYLFGMSPEGMGWDCFRTYELLLLGVIPVVAAKRGGLHGLFDGMPVLVLEDFDRKRTRAEYLQVFREYIASPSFQNTDYEAGWNRLFLRHWRRKMLHVAGRDTQIIKDPVTGKEYYQAWKYTSLWCAKRTMAIRKALKDDTVEKRH